MLYYNPALGISQSAVCMYDHHTECTMGEEGCQCYCHVPPVEPEPEPPIEPPDTEQPPDETGPEEPPEFLKFR
jgi:hypothetical protein